MRTANIDDDRDKRQALEAFAASASGSEPLATAYRDAAASIDSDSERERALAALQADN